MTYPMLACRVAILIVQCVLLILFFREKEISGKLDYMVIWIIFGSMLDDKK